MNSARTPRRPTDSRSLSKGIACIDRPCAEEQVRAIEHLTPVEKVRLPHSDLRHRMQPWASSHRWKRIGSPHSAGVAVCNRLSNFLHRGHSGLWVIDAGQLEVCHRNKRFDGRWPSAAAASPRSRLKLQRFPPFKAPPDNHADHDLEPPHLRRHLGRHPNEGSPHDATRRLPRSADGPLLARARRTSGCAACRAGAAERRLPVLRRRAVRRLPSLWRLMLDRACQAPAFASRLLRPGERVAWSNPSEPPSGCTAYATLAGAAGGCYRAGPYTAISTRA